MKTTRHQRLVIITLAGNQFPRSDAVELAADCNELEDSLKEMTEKYEREKNSIMVMKYLFGADRLDLNTVKICGKTLDEWLQMKKDYEELLKKSNKTDETTNSLCGRIEQLSNDYEDHLRQLVAAIKERDELRDFGERSTKRYFALSAKHEELQKQLVAHTKRSDEVIEQWQEKAKEAIAERDKLRENVETWKASSENMRAILDLAIKERDAAIARAKKAELEHIETAASLGETVKERKALRERVKELEADAYTVAHAIVADEVKKLRARVNELFTDCNQFRAQIDGATSSEGIQRAMKAFITDKDYMHRFFIGQALESAIKASLQVKPSEQCPTCNAKYRAQENEWKCCNCVGAVGMIPQNGAFKQVKP